MNHPQLIVITPVRNEAWVLEAFLTHCSSWADHIIIADQHSTDGSREIASRFPKVTLIDNPGKEMNMSAARLLLFQEVDRMDGDKIVFTLDADEFLSDGFQHTNGWRRILESQPNEIFCFRWLTITNDYHHAMPLQAHFFEWVCHFNPNEKLATLYNKTENNVIHESRLPCTSSARYTNIDDIKFVHLNELNTVRNQNKRTLYQVASIIRGANPISVFRSTHIESQSHPLKQEVHLTDSHGNNIKPLVHTSDHGQHYINEIVAILHHKGFKAFQTLCIWDNPDLRAAGITYTPPFHIRLLHNYLKATQRHSGSLPVRIIDKLLKKII